MMHPEAERLIIALDLQSHPEGGWYRETWRSGTTVEAPGGDRPAGTSILYLLADDAVSRFHRLTSDEVWYLHAGGPVHVRSLGDGGVESVTLDAGSAEPVFQAVVPGGTWFGAELAASAGYALLGCAVAPGFRFEDFEMGTRSDLIHRFPACTETIARLTSGED